MKNVSCSLKSDCRGADIPNKQRSALLVLKSASAPEPHKRLDFCTFWDLNNATSCLIFHLFTISSPYSSPFGCQESKPQKCPGRGGCHCGCSFWTSLRLNTWGDRCRKHSSLKNRLENVTQKRGQTTLSFFSNSIRVPDSLGGIIVPVL